LVVVVVAALASVTKGVADANAVVDEPTVVAQLGVVVDPVTVERGTLVLRSLRVLRMLRPLRPFPLVLAVHAVAVVVPLQAVSAAPSWLPGHLATSTTHTSTPEAYR
jgi:hypothetical protein